MPRFRFLATAGYQNTFSILLVNWFALGMEIVWTGSCKLSCIYYTDSVELKKWAIADYGNKRMPMLLYLYEIKPESNIYSQYD